ncbi:SRPBCC family protein [soil metagenome]|jgi:uncharacterized protein YndB with AHSA1/START domain
MSILINILIGIAGLVVLLLLVAAFLKKDYMVSQSAIINQPKQVVYNYVKLIKNQQNYNKWVMADPNARIAERGVDGSPGFVYAWDSDNKQVGKGEQEILKLADGERIDSEVRFEKPFKNVAQIYMTTEVINEGQTRITWAMYGKNPYPMNLMNLFIPGMLARDMNESLNNLKRMLER